MQTTVLLMMAALTAFSAGGARAMGEQSRAPDIVVRGDARHGRLVSRSRDLTVSKTVTHDGVVQIDVTSDADSVSIVVSANAPIHISRGGHTVAISSERNYAAAQQLLAGSAAIFAARVLLSERENQSDLKSHEVSLLSALAFVASLVGDVDAPRRLSSRFVEKHRGIFRQIGYRAYRNCWDSYESSVTKAWNDMQSCVNEANQDDSWFRAAYRRVACNTVWLLESESAWFELLKCTGTSPAL